MGRVELTPLVPARSQARLPLARLEPSPAHLDHGHGHLRPVHHALHRSRRPADPPGRPESAALALDCRAGRDERRHGFGRRARAREARQRRRRERRRGRARSYDGRRSWVAGRSRCRSGSGRCRLRRRGAGRARPRRRPQPHGLVDAPVDRPPHGARCARGVARSLERVERGRPLEPDRRRPAGQLARRGE